MILRIIYIYVKSDTFLKDVFVWHCYISYPKSKRMPGWYLSFGSQNAVFSVLLSFTFAVVVSLVLVWQGSLLSSGNTTEQICWLHCKALHYY